MGGIFISLYIFAWVFGNHKDTYYMESAKQVGSEWTCPPGEDEDGPYWDYGKGHDPVCHVPARQCPWLWFPGFTVSPCPYKDPLSRP